MHKRQLFLASISQSAIKADVPWSLWGLVNSHFQLEFSGEAAVIRMSIGYWLLQFELTILPHVHWSQLGPSVLHMNQSLPKSMPHMEPNTYISSVGIGFLSLFLHIQYTHNPGYNNKDKNNYERLLNSYNNHFPSSSPVWIPGFQQQMFINPKSLISLSYLVGSFQIHAFTDMFSHAG